MGLDWTRTRLSRLVRLAVAGNTPARANTDMDGYGLDWGTMPCLMRLFWTMMMFGICFLLLVGLGACLDMYAMDSDGVGRQTPGLAWGHWACWFSSFRRYENKRALKNGEMATHRKEGGSARRHGRRPYLDLDITFLEFWESGHSNRARRSMGFASEDTRGIICLFFCMLDRFW